MNLGGFMKKLLFLFILIFNRFSFAELEDYILDKKEEKNEIKVSQEIRVSTLDPIKLSDIYSKRAFRYIYETLFEIDILGNVTPKLAKEYKYLDDNELYIKLKNNVKFQDGTILTSEDVKKSLTRVKEKGALKEFYNFIDSIDIINDLEFIIKLKQKTPYTFEVLSHTMSSIVKEKSGKIIGTGPYSVELLRKDDIILSSIDSPQKKVIIDRVFSAQDRLLSLFNNNSDVIYDVTEFDIERGINLEIINKKDITIQESENIITSALVFGEKRELPFRKLIENILHIEPQYFLPPEIYNEDFSSTDIPLTDKKIKNSLATLDSKEKTIELIILNTEEDRELAKNIKLKLANYGINVKILPYQVDAFYHKIKSKNFDIAIQHLVFNKKYPRISLGKVILYDIYDKKLYEELYHLGSSIETENSLEKREEVFIQILDKLSERLPYIPLEHHSVYILLNKDIEE